jgi:hypothetical protein
MRNMRRVIAVRPLNDYQLEALFDDGTQGVVSLKESLFGPMFEPLRDVTFFQQVRVDKFGAVV